MKKMMFLLMLSASATAAMMTSCSNDDPIDEIIKTLDDTDDNNTTGGGQGGSSTGTSTSVGDLTTFGISIDRTTAEPTSSVAAEYPEDEDDIANNTFGTEVTINFSDNSASYTTPDGVTITNDGAHVVAEHSTKVHYIVSGSTSAGSLTIIGEKKYELELKGATITNPDSTAINLLCRKRAYIVLADGTTNTLSDGTSSKDADQKAAFYCKGKMLFSGSGSLSVTGQTKNAIASADYIVFSQGNNIYAKSTANHAIKANDGIYINGGIINAETSASAAKAINCEADIHVNGGRTTVITTGQGKYDSDDKETKGSAGMKADGAILVQGGQLYAKSTGAGGKGISADLTIDITGGEVAVITTGKAYTSNGDDSKAKGIKADGNLTINGGSVKVRATGGEGSEGIESKGTINIESGTVEVYSYDDAINSKGDLTINGGYIYAQGTNNDAIDANQNLYINGGNVIAIGAGVPENPLDAAEGYNIYINGGNIFAIGGSIAQTASSSKQASIAFSASVSGQKLGLFDSSGNGLMYIEVPTTSNSAVMMTTDGMTAGKSYTVKKDVSVSGGSSFDGLNTTGTISGGTELGSVTAAAQVGQGMGGGRPGGGRR